MRELEARFLAHPFVASEHRNQERLKDVLEGDGSR